MSALGGYSTSGLILAAKLAARELGPVDLADSSGVWDTEKMATDEEWLAFAAFLSVMVRRKGTQLGVSPERPAEPR
jgi:hypothetical protein